MKKNVKYLAILFVLLSLAGCGMKAESEQEKYYRNMNEAQKKAAEIGNKAAAAMENMDTSTKDDIKPPQRNKK